MPQQQENSYEDWLFRSYVNQMASPHSTTALSWRKLYLSRAKLKASSRTSALLSGFAMVALVEISIKEDETPDYLLIMFSVCTTLLVSVHLLALMISTCILPHIEAVSNVHNVTAVHESPHEKMELFIQLAWSFSTGFGIVLFLAEITLVCWLQFVNNKGAAWASTAIVVPVLVIFLLFAAHFYRRLISHKYEKSSRDLEDLEKMAAQLENHSQMESLNPSHHIQQV